MNRLAPRRAALMTPFLALLIDEAGLSVRLRDAGGIDLELDQLRRDAISPILGASVSRIQAAYFD